MTREYRYVQVARQYQDGTSVPEIARRLGIAKSTVQKNLATARDKGLLPRTLRMAGQRRASSGSLHAHYFGLSREIRDWVDRQIPEGSSLEEFAVACVVDAYHEDKEATDVPA